MDELTYLKFNSPKSKSTHKVNSIKGKIENAINKILSVIIPKANPDFDNAIANVDYWYIEFNKKENLTCREIGFNENRLSIVAMPLGNNYGYWTDNQLILEEYENFEVTSITTAEFEEKWNEFILNNPVHL